LGVEYDYVYLNWRVENLKSPKATPHKGKSAGRTVVAVFSDTHSNSTVGLCPPDVNRDDGGKHIQSIWQAWLWMHWNEFIGEVKKEAKGGARVVVIGNGDLVEVDAKDRSNQMISTSKAIALDIAGDTVQPLVDLSDRFILIRGTGAHTGRASEYEEILGKTLGAEPDKLGNHSHWYFLGSISGVLMEITHHAMGGRKASAATGSVARLAEETIVEYGGHHDRIPDLVVRGHVHQHHDSGTNVDGCRAITLPCWTGSTDHVHRLGYGVRLPHIGGTIITCENGNYTARTILYKPLRRYTWEE
jgi:hypothetical protein